METITINPQELVRVLHARIKPVQAGLCTHCQIHQCVVLVTIETVEQMLDALLMITVNLHYVSEIR